MANIVQDDFLSTLDWDSILNWDPTKDLLQYFSSNTVTTQTSIYATTPTSNYQNVKSVLSSNNLYIDALLSGYKWTNNATDYSAITSVSYSFANTSSSRFQIDYSNTNEYQSMRELSAVEKEYVREVLASIAEVCNIKFIEVEESSTVCGVIRYGFTDRIANSFSAWAYTPGNTPASGDIWLSVSEATTQSQLYGYHLKHTILHETMHAIGLKHPFEAEAPFYKTFPSAVDILPMTAMSYSELAGNSNNFLSVYPQEPMLYDVIALQYLYGFQKYNSNNTIYDLSLPEYAQFKLIYDSGGIDTFDASKISNGVTLRLEPMSWSNLGINITTNTSSSYTDTLNIAYTTYIENANGSKFADQIFGNVASNIFTGWGGNDSIDGGSGLDTAVYTGTYGSHAIRHQVNGSFVVADSVSGRDGTDTVTNVERLQFSDYNVALDTDSANSAGGIYRLYQAAFDRKPDLPGLGYWIKAADNGKSAVTMAEDFTWSKEFLDLFHLSTPKDNYFTGVDVKTLVEGMYTHVLHRAADSGGLNYYTGVIQSHEKTVGRVLAEISDSPENHTAVASSIANGIQYTPYTAQAMTSLHLIDDIEGTVAEPQTMALDSYSSYSDQVDLIGQTHDPMLDWMWLG